LTAFFFRDILRKDIIGVERYDNLQLFRIPHTAPIYGGIYEKTEGFKIAVKRALTHLIDENILDPDSVSNIHFFVDEHTTATDGRYELREALEQEFKIGTFNYNFHQFYDPVFPKMGAVHLKWCDSKTTLLVRAADIIANKVYYLRESGQFTEIPKLPNMKVTYFPNHK